jgi:hypothetical protein
MNDQSIKAPLAASAHSLTRRDLLQGGAAAMALALLPAAADASMRADLPQPRWAAGIGHWQGGMGLTDVGRVRAGWMAPCASSTKACAAELNDMLTDAGSVRGMAGNYSLRIIGMNAVERAGPVAIEALYGDAAHHVWQSWRIAGAMQTAAPVSVRWRADAGEPLPLRLSLTDSESLDVAVPARAGVYVLLLSSDGVAPRWRRVAMRALDPERPTTLSLVGRRSGTKIAAPHLLLTVSALAV